MEDTLRILEMFSALNDDHGMQLLDLAETFADWETRYNYGE